MLVGPLLQIAPARASFVSICGQGRVVLPLRKLTGNRLRAEFWLDLSCLNSSLQEFAPGCHMLLEHDRL